MKNFFSLISFIAGMSFFLIGTGIFLSVSQHPANIGAGIVAIIIAAACLWLAKASTVGSEELLS